MKYSRQKDAFLNGEGDNWFERNKRPLPTKEKSFSANEHLVKQVLALPIANKKSSKILEIGCGQGNVLYQLQKKKLWDINGLDPSKKAINVAKEIGINAKVGTADKLPYENDSFDLIIYGFCLYLCDTTDLFQIAAEAHRVLKKSSWISIVDFWSPNHKVIPYHHLSGLYTHKYEFSKMFLWHPDYIMVDHQLRSHDDFKFTDKSDEWLSLTTLRRCDEK